MPFFLSFFSQLFPPRKKKIQITKKQITGEWLHRGEDDVWIFFVFYPDGLCEYLDDEDDIRSWNYSVLNNKLQLWGGDKTKSVSLLLDFNGENLIINGTEYKRAEKLWRNIE